ncbi:unnamed protein product [Acanthoscelides obtectus]|uniref:Kazal-like domain-containing protein n=1 Tax=Acanthoscelides obtectus TaxID=200917 RepID=A0A9P0M199_ACAOB|nr:unnamed protein product [Acanthoscelides obtectus]CAK1647728.1 hypothetical protein AOBTE_LOCUS15370 [Acanthoscelides obtectus]
MIWLLMLLYAIVHLRNVQCFAHYSTHYLQHSDQSLARKPRQATFENDESLNSNGGILFPTDDDNDRFQKPETSFQNRDGSWNNNRRFQNSRNRGQWFKNGGQNNEDQNDGKWFQNEGGHFHNNNRDFWKRTTTPRPRTTTVPIPGSATRRSTCEDQCRATMEYNPVCGTNLVTYTNMQWYKCALRCGKRIDILAYRACARFR